MCGIKHLCINLKERNGKKKNKCRQHRAIKSGNIYSGKTTIYFFLTDACTTPMKKSWTLSFQAWNNLLAICLLYKLATCWRPIGERLLGGQWRNIDLAATALPWPHQQPAHVNHRRTTSSSGWSSPCQIFFEHGDPRFHNTWIKIHPRGLTAKLTALHVSNRSWPCHVATTVDAHLKWKIATIWRICPRC